MLDDGQKEIIKLIQGDIPLTSRPFAQIAHALAISEDDLLQELGQMKADGYLRRIAAILYHRRAGFTQNAMVAWRVPEERVQRVGEQMAASSRTTHVYQRETCEEWPYNLYTMIHGGTREECEEIAQELSRSTGETDYSLLFSTREFKKASMRYY